MSDERFADDEEVRADLRARVSTEYDRSRTRAPLKAAEALGMGSAAIVAQWPCRGGCGALVDVTEAACDAMVQFNKHLRKRLEAPIDTAKTVFCAACRERGRKLSAENARKTLDAISNRVAELRGNPAPNPERERVLIDELKRLGCEEVPLIVAAIRERREAKPETKYRPKGTLR